MPRTLVVAGEPSPAERVARRAAEVGVRTVVVLPVGADLSMAADAAETADLASADALAELAAREGAGGILAASRRAASAVIEAAAALGLPGPGRDAVDAATSRIALRRRLADTGVPQPHFAAVRTFREGSSALARVGLPAVIRPAEPWIDAGRFELVAPGDLEGVLYRTLAASPNGEAIIEGAGDGAELEAISFVADLHVTPIAVVDRATAETRAYPSLLFADRLTAATRATSHAVHAAGIASGVAVARLLARARAVEVLDVSPWTPEDPLDALCRHAVGVDVLELAIRTALGVDVPELMRRPRFHQAAALRIGRVDGAAVAERGEGHVVITATTNLEAVERAAAVAT